MAYITSHLHLSSTPSDDVDVTVDDDGEFWLRLKDEAHGGLWCHGSPQQLNQLAIAIANAVARQERRLREAATAALDFPEVPA